MKPEQFPRLARPVQAKWAPVMLSPLMGSPERLVVGVVAVNGSGFHIERANALRRFECMYGQMAETAVFAAEVALDELAADLAERGLQAISSPRPSFSGISIGAVSEGEAASLEEVARAWMVSLSSLYDAEKVLTLEVAAEREMVAVEESRGTERLPSLVFEYVSSQRPTLVKFFGQEIREQRQRRRRTKTHGVIIDFSGSHVVANFGTLIASSRATSYDRIKSRMWELKVNRDTEGGTARRRKHEMIVQRPGADDPQVSERQSKAIEEAINDLSEQARKEEIGFLPMLSVIEIGNHILQTEVRT